MHGAAAGVGACQHADGGLRPGGLEGGRAPAAVAVQGQRPPVDVDGHGRAAAVGFDADGGGQPLHHYAGPLDVWCAVCRQCGGRQRKCQDDGFHGSGCGGCGVGRGCAVSVSEVLVDEHHVVGAAGGLLPHHRQRPADALRAAAVVAAVGRGGAWRLQAEAACVEWRGRVACAVYGRRQVGRYLVAAGNQAHAAVAVEHSGNAVARAVDVDNLARDRQRVDRREIDVGRGGGPSDGVGVHTAALPGAPMPVDGVARRQSLVEPHLVERHRASEAHGQPCRRRGNGGRRLVARRILGGAVAQSLQIVPDGCKVHGLMLVG